MRKYGHASNRVYLKANEPELQWLENSCGILVQYTVLYLKMIVCGLFQIAFGLLQLGVAAFKARKAIKRQPVKPPQTVVVFLAKMPRPAIPFAAQRQKQLPYITVKALPPQ